MKFPERCVVMLSITAILPISAAHAYLDAASTGLALQAIIGTVAAYILTGKVYWRKFKALFVRKKQSDADLSDPID